MGAKVRFGAINRAGHTYRAVDGEETLRTFDNYAKAERFCIENQCKLYEGEEFLADYQGCFIERPAPFARETMQSLTEELVESERI